MKNIKKWFSLVELIVALTVLIILSTIWFMKYSDYISSSRDATRYSKLKEISDLLKSYNISKTLPVPYNFVEIKALWETIWYQWYVWVDILDKIHYSSDWKDPGDDNYFTYYITQDRKSFQLMWFFEDEESKKLTSFVINKTNAIDYINRYPFVLWDKIWILTDEFNTPVQEISEFTDSWYVDLTNDHKDKIFKAYITNDRVYSFSWELLDSKLYSITHKSKFWDPNNCPEWYISVWGDVDFWQKGFCVAKYEMTFSEKDSPWSPTNSNFNAYDYEEWKYYKSRIDYPVVNLTQEEAIEACKRLWKWYHLITNNEWMTIARQIEFESENWKSNSPSLDDTLYTWNSDYSYNWCNDNTWPNDKATKTWDWNPNCFYKRKNILFNWEIIWDFAWNVAEHVNKANTKDGSGFDDWQTSLGSSTSCFVDWNTVSDDDKSKYGPLLWETSDQWIGWICSPSWVYDNVFIRWWSYLAQEDSWIYNIVLRKNNSSSELDHVWFRCAR